MTVDSTAFTAAQAPAMWIHPTLMLVTVVMSVAFLWQLGGMLQSAKDFSIYTTPPGVGDLLKLGAEVLMTGAAAAGLNIKDAVKNIAGGLGLGK